MSQIPALPPGERRILRREEVEAKTGFKRAHIYNLMKKGQFPKALRLGVRTIHWAVHTSRYLFRTDVFRTNVC